MSDDEIEHLANRLAMVVSDNGEADNAGRAVGALARRLGLSGGQLKAIFMAGAESAAGQTAQIAEQAAQIEALQADLGSLRETLRRTEAAARSMQRERDALRHEAEQLQDALDGKRSARQVRAAMFVVAVLAVAGAGWLAFYGPRLRLFAVEQPVTGTPLYRSAVVLDADTVLRRDPDSSSAAVATLTTGTHLVVKRVLWHNLRQWVEVELGGETGYVLSTDVNLS
jgi:hypothetical protein